MAFQYVLERSIGITDIFTVGTDRLMTRSEAGMVFSTFGVNTGMMSEEAWLKMTRKRMKGSVQEARKKMKRAK